MFLTTMMSVIIMQIDILMLTSLSTLENVGIYTIVAKIAILSLFVSSTINTISGPKFSELYHSNKFDDLKNTAKKSTLLQIMVSVPLIFLLFFTKEYILTYFGSEFVNGVTALTILLITYLYATFFGPVEMFLNMTGKQKQLNIIITTGAFINIGLNYFLIPIYGIEGAAFASLISLVFTKTISTIYIKKIFKYTLIPNLLQTRV
jgi:O-antigen/teichoic acid export membrane protein